MAAASGEGTEGDSDGGSEELVLTPAQLIRSLEQVVWAGESGWGPGPGAPWGDMGAAGGWLNAGLCRTDGGWLGAGSLGSPEEVERAEFLAFLGTGAYRRCTPRFCLQWCLLSGLAEWEVCSRAAREQTWDHRMCCGAAGPYGRFCWAKVVVKAGPGCLAWQIHAWVSLGLPGLSAPLSLR